MSGAMQWTGSGFVPAVGIVPNAGAVKDGFVGNEPARMSVAIPTPQVRREVPTVAASPKNVVAMAKARLREVKAELRRLKALEKEKGELERLIAAAEAKPPKSNLREIKRSVG